MKTRGSMFTVLGAGAIALALSACGDSQGADTKKIAATARAVNVAIEVLQPTDFTESLQLAGVVKALEDVTISPEEGGTLRAWKAAKGQYVERGTVIALLDDAVIRAGYEAALAQYNTAELVYQKQQQVFAEQAISESQLKTSEYARDAARAQADLMKARLERTRIQAPISGIVDEHFADEGEMAPPGVPLARVVNLSTVKVLINVPERYAGRLIRGTPVQFTVLAFPGQTFRGNLSFIGSTVSPDNRTFAVEARLANPGGRLKPDMIARVSVSQESRKRALLIREELVQQVDRDRQIVYVEEGGKARERRLQTGGRSGNMVEVVQGLTFGERLITSGYQNLVDGQTVVIANGK